MQNEMHPALQMAVIAYAIAGAVLAGYYRVLRSPRWWLVTLAVLALLASIALLGFALVMDLQGALPGRRGRGLHPVISLPFLSSWALLWVLRRDYQHRKDARRKGAAVRARKARVGARALRHSAGSARRMYEVVRDSVRLRLAQPWRSARSSNKPARVLHDRVRECLGEFARIEQQRRRWLRAGADGSEVSSFVDCHCGLFDDSGLGLAVDRGECPYPRPVMEKLRKLDQLLKSIDWEQDEEAIISSPGMVSVRSLASEILRELPPAPASEFC